MVKGEVARSARNVVDVASKVVLVTPFTSFRKVQILTQKALLDGTDGEYSKDGGEYGR